MAGPLPQGDPAPADGSLPTQVAIGSESRTFHAYLHIPFCSVRCGYCDFNTYTADELRGEKQADFVDRLKLEIELSDRVIAAANLAPRQLSSVFFGGGTPTLLPASQLVFALNQLNSTYGLKTGAEVTTEANPDTLTQKYVDELAAAGFTRLSIGMQSADPTVLKVLDRSHNPDNVSKAVQFAKNAGLQVSVDLIYGSPTETMQSFETTLQTAIALETDHISAYSLIVEPGTKLARQIKNGDLPEPDEDLQADMYEVADSRLSAAGFAWYEVSNWSRSPETASKHNLAYWTGQDWWGYGPGSHSHIGGVRWWNVKHPSTYAQALLRGESPASGRETLSELTRREESVMLGIRLRDGLDNSDLKLWIPDLASKVSQLISDGLVIGSSAIKGRLVLTDQGRLFADAVVRTLLV